MAVHAPHHHSVTVLTARVEDPTGYGRVLRDGDTVTGIVEHKDATDEQRAINEINSGIYVFDAATLREGLGALTTDNAQGEQYLTDVLTYAHHARSAWAPTSSMTCGRPRESTTASNWPGSTSK